MKARTGALGATLMLAILAGANLATAGVANAPAPVAEEPAVMLPPLVVEEAKSSVPWLYASYGGTEYLSRCSASVTRSYIEAEARMMQRVRILVPEEFFARMEVPAVMIISSQDLKQAANAEILRELRKRGDGLRAPDLAGTGHYDVMPNMRLDDRDMHAAFTYLDERRFEPANLLIAPDHVRFLLERRTPLLPAWLTAGILGAYRTADFVQKPITLPPLIWVSRMESQMLKDIPEQTRTLLPASELFAPDALRDPANQHPRRVRIMEAEVALFFRWALDAGAERRDALWRFAARAATEPVTEELFEASFGFGYAELRDRLSDYLPRAVQESSYLYPGRPPAPPRVEVRRATPGEIARLRGEWERLTIGYVKRRAPEVRERYADQARRTLRRAYDEGDRDPRLLAAMGLCEIDAGSEAGARVFLEPALAARVVRPRAYYEVARLRFADLQRHHPDAKLFSAAELDPILEPLRHAIQQAPPLPEAFALLGEALVLSRTAPAAEDFALLAQGARAYGRSPPVGVVIALAYARHRRAADAQAVLDAGADYIADDATRAKFVQLRGILTAAPAK